ncbi:MAG: uncharacterized protein JWL90_4553 [Chthoniobacteraceae bacterium]|nr:uncharacterized protein [Chthoniobacteraceae bacterium]
MMDLFLRGDYTAVLDYKIVFLALLVSFVCGQMVAWTYMITHTGLSYSRSFVNSLVVMPVIVCLVLMVLSSSLVTAFGLLGVLSIVRFRNVLRDSFDTTFILTVVVLGAACGTQKFASAVIGCGVVSALTVYLWYTSFGTRHRYGLILNLSWSREPAEIPELDRLLKRHTRKALCANRRTGSDGGTELSYRLLLRDPAKVDLLMSELKSTDGISRVSSVTAEDESEF